MAIHENTAQRVRDLLADRGDVTERKMFGGLGFMVAGQMVCAVGAEHMMVRVGREGFADALRQPHAREVDVTGRKVRVYVTVDSPGYASDEALAGWIDTALAYVTTLPPK